MTMTCTVCLHADCEEIDRQLLAGIAHRSIAEQFGLSPSAVFRHKDHVSEAMVKAKDAVEVTRADGLLGHVQYLQDRALSILKQAEASGTYLAAIGAIREARNCVELMAKLNGSLRNNSVEVNVLVGLTPEQRQQRINELLAKNTDAR